MPDQVHLLLVGTSHRHAPIAVREQLAAQAHGQRLDERVARIRRLAQGRA